MRKNASPTKLEEIIRQFPSIAFPEYQREPTVWDRRAKQRLIDSIMRHFDIASIYFYRNEDNTFDCIDGRQRLNAVMSFLGDNPSDEDNLFPFVQINDIYEDSEHPYESLEGKTFRDITLMAQADPAQPDVVIAKQFIEEFKRYEVVIVELKQSAEQTEFNLQFTRLNLGQIINSGEKLHAMLGELRDECFENGGLGRHPFLNATSISTRRYAREQTAAQILAHIFAVSADVPDFARTRHLDLQRLFKENLTLAPDKKVLVDRTRTLLDLLSGAFNEQGVLRNRAMTVSIVLLAWTLGISTAQQANQLFAFVSEFVRRLQWQAAKMKTLAVHPAYHRLIEFQRHLTQASVEKPAVRARAAILQEEFNHWLQHGDLMEDAAYRQATGRNPVEESREAGR
jgi:hypothetical protein